MHSAMLNNKRSCVLLLGLGLYLTSALAQAITINFSAILNPGTCTFNLDKSTLNLGNIARNELTPSTLKAVQPFTLRVSECTGADIRLTPAVLVSGDGMTKGGKWLFRSSESTSADIGVMLVQSQTPPNFNENEIKQGDYLPLAEKGQIPSDQNIQFYAGMTCGDAASCASARAGSLTARIMFTMSYR